MFTKRTLSAPSLELPCMYVCIHKYPCPTVPVGILVTQRLGWAAHDSWNNPFMLFICVCACTLLECSDSIRPASKSLSLSITPPRAPEAKRHSPVASWARACASCPGGETCLGPTSCARAVGTAAPECPRDLILISFGRGDARTAARAHGGSLHAVGEQRGAALRRACVTFVPTCAGCDTRRLLGREGALPASATSAGMAPGWVCARGRGDVRFVCARSPHAGPAQV